jgi:serine/threonine protein kinase
MKVKRYIKRREYIDERVIWVYLIQILEGLKALHDRNVLHRGESPRRPHLRVLIRRLDCVAEARPPRVCVASDLKPANCFLAEDGSIKIGDMNVSKVIKDGNARVSEPSHGQGSHGRSAQRPHLCPHVYVRTHCRPRSAPRTTCPPRSGLARPTTTPPTSGLWAASSTSFALSAPLSWATSEWRHTCKPPGGLPSPHTPPEP